MSMATAAGRRSMQLGEVEMMTRGDQVVEVDGSHGDTQRLLTTEEENKCVFPILDKESLLEHLPHIATVTLLGVTSINILTSNQTELHSDHYHRLKQFLVVMPYALFAVGVAGLALAIATKKRPRLLSVAAGLLLAQLLLLILMGGLVSFVRAGVNAGLVLVGTAGIMFFLLISWSMMCGYPKCLRHLRCAKGKVDDDLSRIEGECQDCGAITTNGKAINQAGEEDQPCPSCGGVSSV